MIGPPPFIGPRDSNRMCKRWLGEAPCGASPVKHVVWTDDMENGFVCAEHLKEVGTVWSYVGLHDFDGSVCGLEGTLWHQELDVCYWPPEPIEPEEKAVVYVDA